jgi:predicted ATPase/class 3 adenylate cyclase
VRNYVGQQLGNYRLIHLLGQGHWGSVYLGEHQHLHTQAAIKVLHGPWDEREVEGFLAEARTLAHLRHPHIVRVLDFGVQEATPFLVMEHAPGGSLRQLHPKGMRLPLETVISYVQQVAAALHYAHEQRLVHRDLKPENLLLGHDQQVWLSDFGLALLAHSSRSQSVQQTAGTVAYMAPEQLQGRSTSASDQYALGVVTYEWLAGERPFSGSYTEVAVQQTLTSPPSLSEKVPMLPSAVEHVVSRALAKDPSARFPTIEAFAIALEMASREDASGRTMPAPEEHYVAVAARPSSSRGLPSGTVTLLFTDMEGSTHLLQQLGDRYARVLAESRSLVRSAFRTFGGHEVDTQGDAFLVAFARAADAVAAAVEIQRSLAAHAWPNGVTVRVRIGLHTGEPQLSTEGYIGLDVHRAARIMSAGHGRQVLLSQTTRNLVEHDLPEGVSLRDLGAHRLKDLQHPSHLFQLVISGLPADFPPLKTLDTHPNNLPIQPTSLIGREKEVATVERLLRREDVHLLTLTGPGGTGKTRLGLQVAAELGEHFTEGVFFVNLAAISDPTLVIPTIAQTLEVKEIADQPLLDLLKAYLRDKHLLLLLDNFEQVISAASEIADLLAACPKLKMIVTSREVLHVRGEQEYAVPPLAVPDPKHLPDLVMLSQYEAVALFIQRAQAVKPEFQVNNANAPAVAEICVRLDGLPLAIELAAARIKLLPPQALLARLGQRLAVLTSGVRDVPARQQNLRNTIEWSYDLLNAEEQRLFRRLSVFAGGCTLEAIESVCAAFGDEVGPVWDAVTSLIDKSLLQQTEQEAEEPRLMMLETIREFGLERLTASGELERTRVAHAHYFLTVAEQAEPELDGPNQAIWVARLEHEHDNLREALEWALEKVVDEKAAERREIGMRLSAALTAFWMILGHYREARTFLERTLALSEGTSTALRARVLRAIACVADVQGDIERIEVVAQQSLTFSRELEDTCGIAESLGSLAAAAWFRGKIVEAISLHEEQVRLLRQVGEPGEVADALFPLAEHVSTHGEYARGQALFEEALQLFRQAGNELWVGGTLVHSASWLWFTLGDLATMRQRFQEGQVLIGKVGDRAWSAECLWVAALLALSEGEPERASSLAQESLSIYREIGDPWYSAWLLHLLGRIETQRGEMPAARRCYQQSLELNQQVGEKWMTPFNLEGLATVVATQGTLRWAVQLWGAAEALREVIDVPRLPVDRVGYEQAVAAAQAQLGEEAFASVWQEGRTMKLEQVLAS